MYSEGDGGGSRGGEEGLAREACRGFLLYTIKIKLAYYEMDQINRFE